MLLVVYYPMVTPFQFHYIAIILLVSSKNPLIGGNPSYKYQSLKLGIIILFLQRALTTNHYNNHSPTLISPSRVDTTNPSPVGLKLLQQSHGLLLGLRRAGRQSQQLRPSEAGCGRVGRGDLGVGMATGVLPGMGQGRATLGRSQQKWGSGWLFVALYNVILIYTLLYSQNTHFL